MPYSLAVEKMKGRESHGFDLTPCKTYAATGAFGQLPEYQVAYDLYVPNKDFENAKALIS
jgi:hypothetical protein